MNFDKMTTTAGPSFGIANHIFFNSSVITGVSEDVYAQMKKGLSEEVVKTNELISVRAKPKKVDKTAEAKASVSEEVSLADARFIAAAEGMEMNIYNRENFVSFYEKHGDLVSVHGEVSSVYKPKDIDAMIRAQAALVHKAVFNNPSKVKIELTQEKIVALFTTIEVAVKGMANEAVLLGNVEELVQQLHKQPGSSRRH